ncbi:MAG: hypothetical protein Q4D56_08805 [Bacteroides sp.]|nr:hypothetical protein [Bacteroides sp.]
MRNRYYISVLFIIIFLSACAQREDKRCSLPSESEWTLADGNISFKVEGDSLLWLMNSDAAYVPPLSASSEYQLYASKRIIMHSHLPLSSQDLTYVYGEKVAGMFEAASRAYQCKVEKNRLILYTSDSIVFYRKK